MKFSIRELLLVTVIVAVVLGWWEDRNRLTGKLREYENTQMPNTGGMPGMAGITLKEWNEKTEAQREAVRKRYWDDLLNSQAPAQNPPNP